MNAPFTIETRRHDGEPWKHVANCNELGLADCLFDGMSRDVRPGTISAPQFPFLRLTHDGVVLREVTPPNGLLHGHVAIIDDVQVHESREVFDALIAGKAVRS